MAETFPSPASGRSEPKLGGSTGIPGAAELSPSKRAELFLGFIDSSLVGSEIGAH